MAKHRILLPLWALLLATLACGPVDLARDILGRLPTATPAGRSASFESLIWYVEVDGDDGNRCTADAPCRTIRHVMSLVTDDDEIVLGAGTYTEPDVPASAGYLVHILNLRLSIRGQGPDATIIDAGGTRTGILISGTSQVGLRNLTVANGGGRAPGNCISHRSTGRVTLQNVEVHHCSKHGIEHYSEAELRLVNVTSRDNLEDADGFGGRGVSSFGFLTIEGGSFSGNAQVGILSRDLEMTGGLVENNGLEGIIVSRGTIRGVTLRDNTLHPRLGWFHGGLLVNTPGDVTVAEVSISRSDVCLLVRGGAVLDLRDSELRDCPAGGLLVERTAEATVESTTIASNGRRYAGTGLAAGVGNYGRLTLGGSTVQGNYNGGILNEGELILRDSWVLENTGLLSGLENKGNAVVESSLFTDDRSEVAAVYNRGTMTMTNSTVSGNPNIGVQASEDGDLTLDHVTISENAEIGLNSHQAPDGIARISNSLIANNAGRSDCLFGSFFGLPPRAGTNIDSDGSCGFARTVAVADLHLDPLADNGGPTQTHALLTGSPAIDAATGACPATDQRGATRPFGSACDVGAYEVNPLFSAMTTSLEGTIEPPVTVTPVAAPEPTVQNDSRCRKGPGPGYETVSSVLAGTVVELLGRGAGGGWWVIDNPRYPGVPCWLPEADLAVDPSLNVAGLRVYAIPPLPTPTSATLLGCWHQGPNDNAPMCYVPCPANPNPGGTCTP